MSTLPEQFSEARKTQVETQLNMFRSFSSKAVESAEQIIALNLSTSRASVEKSADAMRQLLTVKDPRDLLSLTTHTQAHFESLLAYGRALFSIATSAPLPLPTQAAAAPVLSLAPAPAPAPAAAPAAAAPAPAPAAPAAAPAPALHAVPDSAPAPVVAVTVEPEVQAEPVPEPVAKAKPLAKAISKAVAPEPAEVPAAAPLAAVKPRTVAVSGVKPVEASPPPAPVSGKPAALSKQGESGAAKGPKKK